MKLYVDDKRYCPPGWQVARTVSDAITFLESGKVEKVSLDFDRNPATEGGTENFEDVAKFIKSMPEDKRPEVSYHTANPAGEEEMRNTIGCRWLRDG